jgi:FtsP/CotA-like multicopper oxidase with cupredoxin domain
MKTRLIPGFAFLGAILLSAFGSARASTLVTQTALPGDCVPQFKVELPVFGPAGDVPRVDAFKHPLLTIKMKETGQIVLPDPSMVKYPSKDGTGKPCPHLVFQDTKVWTYETSDSLTGKVLGPANWPAVTLEATRFVPTVVTYENELPAFDRLHSKGMNFVDGLVQGLLTVDQTIHWADPLDLMCGPIDCTRPENAANACCKPFVGRPPAVPHLHGAEVPPAFDGGATAWFTADGRKGPGFATLGHPGEGAAIYQYNNTQEPGTLWFHDHALGATRTGVYSGLEAFYFLRDASKEPKNLPAGPHEIEMVFQDRQFDTHSQLFFPDGSGADAATSNLNGTPTNPNLHPFWSPEFIGDVAVVNGAPWPFLEVEPRRYLFRLLDGSNARVYRLRFGNAPVYQVGADDNYLDAPVKLDNVFLAPAERAYVIVDFSDLRGQTVTVTNDAPVPFPDGLWPVPHIDPATGLLLPADQPRMASIMQFRVSSRAVSDASCDPAAGQCKRPTPLLRLTDGKGNITPGVRIDKVRQLVLKEHEGPGGPVEVLLNNTHFDADVTETPRVGSIEMWEIINETGDAHPIHTHLVQFEILNRETYDFDGTQGSANPSGFGYVGVDNGDSTSIPGEWPHAFDTAVSPFCDRVDPVNPCPGFGPPLPYDNHGRKTILDGRLVPVVGGNPDILPYLLGDVQPPAPEEAGLKDTAKSIPGKVMRILVRWAPTSAPLTPNRSLAGTNLYPFNPSSGDGYLWHCHILDHEDNDMMRPYNVAK